MTTDIDLYRINPLDLMPSLNRARPLQAPWMEVAVEGGLRKKKKEENEREREGGGEREGEGERERGEEEGERLPLR